MVLMNAVGKRVVGRQNILPLLRDTVEDAREVEVCLDTENRRYVGVPIAINPGTNETVVLKGQFPQRKDRAALPTKRIIALEIRSVGPDPGSPAGQMLERDRLDREAGVGTDPTGGIAP